MLYIFLSALFIKKVNNFNKTWLKHIEDAESEFRTFEFVISKFIISKIIFVISKVTLYEYKVNKINRNYKIIVETRFQRFY